MNNRGIQKKNRKKGNPFLKKPLKFKPMKLIKLPSCPVPGHGQIEEPIFPKIPLSMRRCGKLFFFEHIPSVSIMSKKDKEVDINPFL